MGKLITILGGCLVTAGGVSYGLYTYTDAGCDGACPLAAASVAASDDCCSHSDISAESGACPLSASAETPSCCASSKAQAVSASACPLSGEGCGESAASATADAGVQAVVGSAAFAAKK